MSIKWTNAALKDVSRIQEEDAAEIVAKVNNLSPWPSGNLDIKPMAGSKRKQRLRVGKYRVIFEVDTATQLIKIEEVKKRGDIY